MTDTADLSEFGLFDPAIQQCPHAYYAKMQQDAPVYPAEIPGGTLHLVTRYDDVTEIVRDVATFSNRFDTAGANFHPELAARMKELYEAEGGYDKIGTMLTVDPPDHTRFRRLVTKAFTPKVIADLEPTIREITRGLVADVIAAMGQTARLSLLRHSPCPCPSPSSPKH